MSHPSPGIERTLRTLLSSTNPAATDLLVVAAESENEPLRLGAIRALALKKDPRAHKALIERFREFDERSRSALADVDHHSPLLGYLIDQIRSDMPRRARRAVELGLAWNAVGIMPATVEAVLWATGEDADFFAASALQLAGLVESAIIREEQRDVTTPRGDDEDPAFLRRALIGVFTRVLDRYSEHQQAAIIEAMLMITPHDDPSLVRALQQPNHPAHSTLIDILRKSHSRGTIAVLAAILMDPSSPRELLDLASSRREIEVISAMFRRIGSPVGARARQSVERIESFAWMDGEHLPELLKLEGEEQAVAIELAAASKVNPRILSDAICLLLDEGSEAGRRSASRAIDRLPSHIALEPLSVAIDSKDPAIASAAAKILRKKDYPQATDRLVRMLDSTEESVRQAAQRALHEVSFVAFRDHFESMSPVDQRRAGGLVAKADPMAVITLASELQAAATSRRLRAIEMIELMQLAEAMKGNLIETLTDRDAGVRAEAARVLGDCKSNPSLRAALEAALEDGSTAVKAAAEASLLQLDATSISKTLSSASDNQQEASK